MTPFEKFYEQFLPLLETVGDAVVFSNGLTIAEASWDRKAAYLLWRQAEGGMPQMKRKIETAQRPDGTFVAILYTNPTMGIINVFNGDTAEEAKMLAFATACGLMSALTDATKERNNFRPS